MKTDNLDGLVNFHAPIFPAPKDVKAAFAEGVSAYEEGKLSNVERSTFLGAKRLTEENGKVGAAWIRKGLAWWDKEGKSATDEERTIYGGEKGRAWLEKCVKELDTREEEGRKDDEAGALAYKNLAGEVTDVDQMKGIVSGYAARKGNWDSANEMIMDGAFLNSIKEWGPQGRDRIKTLWQHNPAYLIGRPTELSEDSTGLKHVTQISKTSLGKDIIRLIADKVITEQSIGYNVLDAEPNDEKSDHWHLKSLKLFEYSFVTWGANEFTPIHGIKSEWGANTLLKGMKETINNADKALRSGEWETDEIPTMVGLLTKQLTTMIRELELRNLGEDDFEATKAILIPHPASTTESVKTTEVTPTPKENPEGGEDEAILSLFKSAKFTPTAADASVEEELLAAFKSFSLVEEK